MTGFNLIFDTRDVREGLDMLSQLERLLDGVSMGAFLGSVVDPYLRMRTRDRFAEEGDDVVGAWAPLASTTQDIRASMGYGPAHPINVRTGEMERWATQSPERITMHSIGATLTTPGKKPTGKLEAKVGMAQKGAGKMIPKRPIIGVNERDLAFTVTALQHFIEQRVR